jgi:UDP-glucose 4-epimerase
MNDNKLYLVIGANGFVGSHVVDALAEQPGVSVRAFDRFSRDIQYKPNGHVEKYAGDVFSESDLSDALKGVYRVIHCFSATTPFTAEKNPHKDIDQNISNSVKIFQLCVENGVDRIGFISSGGAVYGLSAEAGEVSEETAPRPVSPYGIGKLTIENYLDYFKRVFGVSHTIYRLTNPYGPRQKEHTAQGVIPVFIDKILNNETITIFGDGSMSRDYIYIEDAAEMIARSFVATPKYDIYNIGSGQQTNLNQLVAYIEEATGKKADIVYEDSPKTFLHRTPVSVDRFVEEFDHTTRVGLQDGITKTVSQKIAKN